MTRVAIFVLICSVTRVVCTPDSRHSTHNFELAVPPNLVSRMIRFLLAEIQFDSLRDVPHSGQSTSVASGPLRFGVHKVLLPFRNTTANVLAEY